ncbi:MFS transporter [Arthrobacter sp. KNU40]|uniref:MFS transporter n=1 Tax=Arthrobacter sp. KNU40 TaxID=3447965 RepID=UPI003F5D884C
MVGYGADVSMIAILDRPGQESGIGIVIAFWSGASLIGGLVYGAMHRPVSPILLLLAVSALTIPMAFAGDTWSLAVLSVPSGLLYAPVMTAAPEKVTKLVDESRRAEVMGWYASALTLGGALGAPLAGIFIDTVGPWSGFVAIGAMGLAVCLGSLALQRRRSARA